MVIDFAEHMRKKQEERDRIEAEFKLDEARERLADAYADKGLRAVFEQNGLGDVSDETVEAFRPLMLTAIEEGLTAAEIEAMILMSVQDVVESD